MTCKWKAIREKVIAKGAKIEAREHPWATKKQAKKIAADHVKKEGLRAYRGKK
jgi:Na+-translocating ferredoxin:NAD+ oxidoreductase RnfG subunit